jgi:sarcosine oxidase
VTGVTRPHAWDAIVIGLGAHGSGAVLALARRGLRVLGLEAGEQGHELGSSGGRTRMIRRAYFEDPAYVPLLREARALWDEVGAARGEPMIEIGGGLYAGGEGSAVLRGSVASAEEQGLDHELLSADEVRRRWPLFELDPGFSALWDPGAGFIRSDRAIAGLLELARLGGAELQFGERVSGWRAARDGGVEVTTDAATYRAPHLVIAAGAWTPSMLPDVRLPLEIERVPVFWFEPTVAPGKLGADRLPVWIVDTADGAFYGFAHDPGLGLKVARHYSGDVIADPSAVDRAERPADVERVRAFMRGAMPGANGRLRHSIVCLYATTPDHHFVIDTHPTAKGVAFASACSGHGFKFAPVIGEILADLAIDGRTDHPIQPFRSSRFGDG